LKSIFKDRTPQGEWIEAEILPAESVADGDLSKYKFAKTLLSDTDCNRTETAIGMTEDKKFLFVAFKCYESAMDKVVENTKFFDRPSIFEDDYVQILLNTPTKNYFSILVNPAGAVVPIAEARFPAPFASVLEFNAPVHGTWNIVHTGMLVPDARQIYVCAANCMRGVTLTAAEMNELERFSFVILEEEDLVEGTVEEVITKDILSDIYRVDFEIQTIHGKPLTIYY
jgi:hypothetical protein